MKRNFLRTAGLVLVVAFGISGCAHREPELRFKEMSESVCHFSKKKIPDSPEALVKGYLDHDAAGDFTVVSGWFDSTNLCPGKEGGPEVTYVVKDYHLGYSNLTHKGSATVVAEYTIVGMLEPGMSQSWHFVKKKKKQTRTFTLVHTAYGWRFRDVHLPDGQYLSIASAKTRATGKADKKALARLESRKSS